MEGARGSTWEIKEGFLRRSDHSGLPGMKMGGERAQAKRYDAVKALGCCEGFQNLAQSWHQALPKRDLLSWTGSKCGPRGTELRHSHHKDRA